MEEERGQKELFEFEKPKRRFPGLGRFLPKADFERNVIVTLSLEKTIFVSIGIVMLLVIVYAIGVEVGKSKGGSERQVLVQKLEIAPAPPATPAKPPPQVKAPQLPAKPYTIVAGTFSRKDNALGAVNRLKREGLDAYIGQTKPYFKVYVGSYASKDGADAQQALSNVKRFYKDAFLDSIK